METKDKVKIGMLCGAILMCSPYHLIAFGGAGFFLVSFIWSW